MDPPPAKGGLVFRHGHVDDWSKGEPCGEGRGEPQPVDRMSGSAVPDEITVVSGLLLSGTSMMMKMLGVGGLELVTDNLRAPDQGNSQGHFEFQDVRRLHGWRG